MKKHISSISTLAVSGFLAALFTAGCTSASAQAANNSLTTNVTLTTSSTIMQGEPIVLHYCITNTGSKQLEMGISLDKTRFLTQTLEDAQGKVTLGDRPVDTNTSDDQTGLFNGGTITPHSKSEGDVVTNQWFRALAPGTYTLSVHTSISYSDTDQVALTAPHSKVAGFRQDREEFQFPLVVTPAAPSHLQTMAQKLEQEVIQLPAGERPKRKLLLGKLFSLPEAQALPSWKKLASSQSLSFWALSDVLDNLMHVKTAATADILMDMIASYSQKPTVDPYLASDLINAMSVTFRDGDLPLQQHIRALYAARGMPLAEVLGLPGREGRGN